MYIDLIFIIKIKIFEFREHDSHFPRSNISSEVSYKQQSVCMTDINEINENVINGIKIEI